MNKMAHELTARSHFAEVMECASMHDIGIELPAGLSMLKITWTDEEGKKQRTYRFPENVPELINRLVEKQISNNK